MTSKPLTYLKTPLITYQGDNQIFLKPENLQPFNSYKIRGVQNFFYKKLEQLKRRGLVIASAGNMAQAVAYYSKNLGVDCTIYIPDSAPLKKKEALEKLGANVVEKPFNEVWSLAKNGYQGPKMFLHPALTPELTEGYASIAHEILDSRESISAIVIPFGVGGLITGIGSAIKQLNPNIKIFAAEIETAAPLKNSLTVGKASSVQHIKSFVDAIGTPEVLPEVFEAIIEIVSDSIVVSLEETKEAIASIANNHSMIIEGAAGVALAAAKKLSIKKSEGKIVTILSGGNLDLNRFSEINHDQLK